MTRIELIAEIKAELAKGRSVLATGTAGSGKSWLLGSVARELDNAWYFEKVDNRKAQLLDFAKRLHGEEQANPGSLTGELEQYALLPDWEDISKKVARWGLNRLSAAVIPLLKNKIIVFDDVHRATEAKLRDVATPLLDAGVVLLLAGSDTETKHAKMLNHVRNKCVVMEIPAMTETEAKSFLWQLLNRDDYLYPGAIESKIINEYDGLPGVVADLATQMAGTQGSYSDIRNLSHTDAAPINLFWPVMVVILIVAASGRYLGRAYDDPSIAILAGAAGVLLLGLPRLIDAMRR